MRVLAIDTCGLEASAALGLVGEGGLEVLAEVRMPGRSASERLVADVRGCCGAAGWRVSKIEAIVVVHGPGSFTGVRVGVSAAKGFAEASGARVVAVSRLEVLAHQIPGGVAGRSVRAVLEAGRGELFCGVYADTARLEERLMTVGDVVGEMVLGEVLVACETSVLERLAGVAGLTEVGDPGAVEAMWWAAGHVRRREFVDPAVVDGYYLRRTEAEIAARSAGYLATK